MLTLEQSTVVLSGGVWDRGQLWADWLAEFGSLFGVYHILLVSHQLPRGDLPRYEDAVLASSDMFTVSQDLSIATVADVVSSCCAAFSASPPVSGRHVAPIGNSFLLAVRFSA